MLASKSLGIDFPRSEKQTLVRFLALYILLTVIIILVFSFIYFELQKDLMLQEKKSTLQKYSKELIEDLKQLHVYFDKTQIYPRSDKFDSAIFDNEKKLIFSTNDTKLRLDKILYLESGVIHLVNIPESYYLGARYIIVKVKDDEVWLEQTKKEIITFGAITFLFMLVIGYILLRLFLKPMRDAITLLDEFIKDTTHELNTPVSTIVANIEMIDKSSLDEKLLKKINRIDIGAKTVSNIYQDLTYLTLGNEIASNNEDIDIEQLVLERVEYFTSLALAKKIKICTNIRERTFLHVDKFKISKLLDNLLSNAIKYNKVGGEIIVTVESRVFSVEDSGIGIAEEDISEIQGRYKRFNKSSGGFGIGLSIVSAIAKEYNLKIDITSKERVGTKVSVSW
ncbi:HAMP domain-containing histidine kinase [Candidatus Sulfurimonas marisnigri]|uniref:histidine kinase n=1 Tax=Candidatus Sulfurimonas marisnigri TaxID=2740405 RepID=A0A7S7M217_9BACT|nr:HAMP domain-containing sensor histidine kinase [Candidatus Sulfurimonas marisnigri]QOY54799.1 HAMP domain-containing histidine kinase [Candidatus Sulfurimonas marisnigri]